MFSALYQSIQVSSLPVAAQTALGLLVDIGQALLIVLVGMLISYFLRALIHRLFHRQQEKSPERNYLTAGSMLNSIIKYATYFIIITQILTMFGISATSILAVAGVGSIAIGFGAQSMVADIITGATIIFENQFKVGDWIEINNHFGKVEAIGLRTTRIKALNGNVHIFPNSNLRNITNSSQGMVKAQVEIPIAYSENIDHILSLLQAEMGKTIGMEGLLAAPEILGITSFGDKYMTIRILADTQAGYQWTVERQLRYMIKRCFEEAGVTAPPLASFVPINK